MLAKKKRTWLVAALGSGLILTLFVRFGLTPVTLAALTDEVAQTMGWKEHFVLHEAREGSYTVVMSEGTTLGVQRRVSITPTDIGSEVLIFPPDEGIAARLRERVLTYLTEPTSEDIETGPQIKRFSRPFSQVWRAVKLTVIDGGFSFKTVDDDVGFIETERVSLGKASRSWFRGVGQVGLIAHPHSLNYNCASIEWRYRIRTISLGTKSTEVSVEAVVEATPDSSTLTQLTRVRSTYFPYLLARGLVAPRLEATHPGSLSPRGGSSNENSLPVWRSVRLIRRARAARKHDQRGGWAYGPLL